jgi:hypothetical protein
MGLGIETTAHEHENPSTGCGGEAAPMDMDTDKHDHGQQTHRCMRGGPVGNASRGLPHAVPPIALVHWCLIMTHTHVIFFPCQYMQVDVGVSHAQADSELKLDAGPPLTHWHLPTPPLPPLSQRTTLSAYLHAHIPPSPPLLSPSPPHPHTPSHPPPTG